MADTQILFRQNPSFASHEANIHCSVASCYVAGDYEVHLRLLSSLRIPCQCQANLRSWQVQRRWSAMRPRLNSASWFCISGLALTELQFSLLQFSLLVPQQEKLSNLGTLRKAAGFLCRAKGDAFRCSGEGRGRGGDVREGLLWPVTVRLRRPLRRSGRREIAAAPLTRAPVVGQDYQTM